MGMSSHATDLSVYAKSSSSSSSSSSGLASTRMSPFGILLELRVKGSGGDDWSYTMCKALVKLASPIQ